MHVINLSTSEKQRSCSAALIVAAASLVLASLPAPSAAQSQEGTRDLEAVCLSQISKTGNESAIIVPAKSAAGLEAKGFEREPCNTKFSSQAARAAYRDKVCALASDPDEYFQTQAQDALGERAAVLCAMAEIVVGPWSGIGKRSK